MSQPVPPEKRITWDDNKNKINQKKHRIAFEEAATVFYDVLSLTVDDPDHSKHERRFKIIGESHAGRLIIVTFTERADEIRIITADKPQASERRDYEKGKN